MPKKLESSFECYCGFQNKILFHRPTPHFKAWLEHDCLKCGARFDLRIYQDDGQYKLFKRLIKTSQAVNKVIADEAKKDAAISDFKFNNNGVLNGKEKAIRESIDEQNEQDESH